jgi:hypothetical protein
MTYNLSDGCRIDILLRRYLKEMSLFGLAQLAHNFRHTVQASVNGQKENYDWKSNDE